MLYIGYNSIGQLSNLINKKENILMFTGNTVWSLFGDDLKKYFEQINLITYSSFSSNPKYEEIKECVEMFQNNIFHKIIAFGGGSVIDFAKAFKFYSKRNIPLIAIPTTAGTGSEATQFAAIYENGIKRSLDDAFLLPQHAIVDSYFSMRAPKYIKACCAMDAYCQAIESFWAKKATQESKKISIEAIELCKQNIFMAINSSDTKANENMIFASNKAGQAINISRTTAAHALSYRLTSKYKIPHGHAVALCLPPIFSYNIKFMQDASELLSLIGITQDGVFEYFHTLMTQLNMEDCFDRLGIYDITDIASSVNQERLLNNPAPLTTQKIIELLEEYRQYTLS